MQEEKWAMAPSTLKALNNLESTWAALDAIRAANGMADDEIPEHAVNAEQYAERYNGIPLNTAKGQLKALVEKGLMQSGVRKMFTGGQLRLTRWYWPKEEVACGGSSMTQRKKA